MRRLLALSALAPVLASGCTLEYQRCGENGIGCPGTQGKCVCATGRCADPDVRCPSGLHYVGSRCVPESEVDTAIDSTPEDPGACAVPDVPWYDGADDGRTDDGARDDAPRDDAARDDAGGTFDA